MKRSPTSSKKRGLGSPQGTVDVGPEGRAVEHGVPHEPQPADRQRGQQRGAERRQQLAQTSAQQPQRDAQTGGERDQRRRLGAQGQPGRHDRRRQQPGAPRRRGAQGPGAGEPGQGGQVVAGLVELAHGQGQGDQGGDRQERRSEPDLEVAQPAPRRGAGECERERHPQGERHEGAGDAAAPRQQHLVRERVGGVGDAVVEALEAADAAVVQPARDLEVVVEVGVEPDRGVAQQPDGEGQADAPGHAQAHARPGPGPPPRAAQLGGGAHLGYRKHEHGGDPGQPGHDAERQRPRAHAESAEDDGLEDGQRGGVDDRRQRSLQPGRGREGSQAEARSEQGRDREPEQHVMGHEAHAGKRTTATTRRNRPEID